MANPLKKAFYFVVGKVCWNFPRLVPDKLCIKTLYYRAFGKELDLENPTTYSEKLQWLKLYNRKPEYSRMVDKATAKDYVSEKIGEKYIIPTLGIWDRVEDIDWDALPDKFVIKCTHDSGGVVICSDKASFDRQAAISQLRKGLRRNYYLLGREWPYKSVPHRIIAEKYLEPDPVTHDLPDYKFSCFDGQVTDVMICSDRASGKPTYYFFDKDWKLLPLNVRGRNAPEGFTLPKPACIDEMFDIASKLSKGLPYVRVDLYAEGDHPYFGEMTLFPHSGYDPNLLPETEKWHGSLIRLPEKTNR